MYKKYTIVAVLSIILILLCTFTADGKTPGSSGKSQEEFINNVISGAVEDISWMKARSKNEVYNILSSYFKGQLLHELTDSTWEFVRLNTDWYHTAQLERTAINFIDGNNAEVLAYIKEKNELNGHISRQKLFLELEKTPGGWRIINLNTNSAQMQ